MNNKIILITVPILMIIAGTFMWIEKPQKTEPTKEFILPESKYTTPDNTPSGYNINCSRNYKPVCGTLEGKETTFPNTCAANSKGAQIVRESACEEVIIQKEIGTVKRTYQSRETEACEKEPECPENGTAFKDEQGCGCEVLLNTTKDSSNESDIKSQEETSVIPDVILFEGCPGVLYELLCPDGYSKFEEANECGCKK